MTTTRLIIDTNQASAIHRYAAQADYHPIIVVPPLTWAEILNCPRDAALRRARAIAQYDVLFGMELGDIYDKLRTLPEDEIQSFEPIYPAGSVEHKVLLKRLYDPSEQDWKRAAKIRAHGAAFSTDVERRLSGYRLSQRVKKSKGEQLELLTFESIEAAMHRFFDGPNAAYRQEFVNLITEDGALPLVARSNDSFFDAILRNPMLRRFLRLHASLVFGYADTWHDTHLNVGVSNNRNDVPDMLMPLYARDGDVILTADTILRRHFRHADGRNAIRLSTWKEEIGIEN